MSLDYLFLIVIILALGLMLGLGRSQSLNPHSPCTHSFSITDVFSFYGEGRTINFIYHVETRNDGRTIRTGLMACKMVQIASTSCASLVLVGVHLLVTISEII